MSGGDCPPGPAARRLGRWIAAISGVGLLGSLLMPWYVLVAYLGGPGGSGPPVGPGSPLAVAVAAVAAAGVGLLAVGAVRETAAIAAGGWVAALALCVALGVVHRLAPQMGLPSVGVVVALACSLGLAGGCMLAAVGDRVFEATARAPALVGAAAALVLAGSLFAPWGQVPAPDGPQWRSGWEEFVGADLLVVLCALALLGGAAVAGALRWRAVYLALALGGWLAAAVPLVAVGIHQTGVRRPGAGAGAPPDFVLAPGWGLVVALAACACLVVASLWAACTRLTATTPSSQGIP